MPSCWKRQSHIPENYSLSRQWFWLIPHAKRYRFFCSIDLRLPNHLLSFRRILHAKAPTQLSFPSFPILATPYAGTQRKSLPNSCSLWRHLHTYVSPTHSCIFFNCHFSIFHSSLWLDHEITFTGWVLLDIFQHDLIFYTSTQLLEKLFYLVFFIYLFVL